MDGSRGVRQGLGDLLADLLGPIRNPLGFDYPLCTRQVSDNGLAYRLHPFQRRSARVTAGAWSASTTSGGKRNKANSAC